MLQRKFCQQCGTKLDAQGSKCPNCDKEFNDSQIDDEVFIRCRKCKKSFPGIKDTEYDTRIYCPECGRPIKPNEIYSFNAPQKRPELLGEGIIFLLCWIVFILSSIHIVAWFVFNIISPQERGVVGGIISLSPKTANDLFLGKFYALGEGKFHVTKYGDENVDYSWDALARQPLLGKGGTIIKKESDPLMDKGNINVDLFVPEEITIIQRTLVYGYITIEGYTAKQVDYSHYENEIKKVSSEEVCLALYPKYLFWLVRLFSTEIFLLSLFLFCISGPLLLGLSKKRKKRFITAAYNRGQNSNAFENVKVSCKNCGNLILTSTAKITDGLCMPCVKKRKKWFHL